MNLKRSTVLTICKTYDYISKGTLLTFYSRISSENRVAPLLCTIQFLIPRRSDDIPVTYRQNSFKKSKSFWNVIIKKMLFGVWHLLKSQVFCASICLPIWALQRRIRGADFGTEAAFKASFWWWIVRICWRSLLKGWPDLKWQGIDYVFLLKNLYSEFCAVFPSPWCCLLVLHSFFAICEWQRRQQERKRQTGSGEPWANDDQPTGNL